MNDFHESSIHKFCAFLIVIKSGIEFERFVASGTMLKRIHQSEY